MATSHGKDLPILGWIRWLRWHANKSPHRTVSRNRFQAGVAHGAVPSCAHLLTPIHELPALSWSANLRVWQSRAKAICTRQSALPARINAGGQVDLLGVWIWLRMSVQIRRAEDA
jgi:hypothetical protein